MPQQAFKNCTLTEEEYNSLRSDIMSMQKGIDKISDLAEMSMQERRAHAQFMERLINQQAVELKNISLTIEANISRMVNALINKRIFPIEVIKALCLVIVLLTLAFVFALTGQQFKILPSWH